MSVSGPDYERIAMCAHPEGTHEHIPLKPGEDPPERCFADCDCEPVVFVRADIHVESDDLREIARLLDRSTQTGKAPTADEWQALTLTNALLDRLGGQ